MENRPTYDELEQLLAERTAELSKATTDLMRMEKESSHREEVMKVQRDLSIALSTTYDLNEGLNLSLEAGLQVSGMDCGGIYLFNLASGDLHLQVHQGLSEEFVQAVAHFDKDSDNARYAQRGKPTYTVRRNVDVPLSPTEHREGVRAFISIPLLDGAKVVGCMNLSSKKVKTVPLETRIPIETVAAHIGSAVSLIKVRAELRESEEHLRSLRESAANFAIYRLTNDESSPHKLKVAFVSNSVKEILGIQDPMKFESWFENMHPDDVERIAKANQAALNTMNFNEEYRTYNHKLDEYRWIHAVSTGTVNESGWTGYVNGIMIDVTEKYEAYRKLKDSEKELGSKTKNLMEMNAALNALIKNMESKESDFQEQVTANIQHLVLPYLQKIKDNTANGARKSLIDIVELNLNNITANFTHQLSSSRYRLTSTEIKVADLVRLGKTTKEIAATLRISYKTVETHREKIRKKLGLNNKKINLRSHLRSIQ
jgi:DNA-binding CsgD family transcriptional regulator/PAS domain-containing protein